MSYISGNIAFCGNSVNLSSSTGQIDGISYFFGSSRNCGLVSLAEFSSNSKNLCTVYTATFSDNSTNDCIVLEQVQFFENAVNNNCVCGIATFYGNSSNSLSGQLAGATIFCDGAVNSGTIPGTACFYGTSLNSGIVEVAIFNEGACNLGTISGSGLFYGTSLNCGVVSGNALFSDTSVNNGDVEGNANFADTSVNNGDVQGNANFATGACNQGGTVGSSGVYTPPYTGTESSATNWTNCFNDQWFNLYNWFSSDYSTNIAIYPLSSTNVIMSGNCAAFVNIDCNLWVQPYSINTTRSTSNEGICIYSENSASFSGIVYGSVTLSGNANYK